MDRVKRMIYNVKEASAAFGISVPKFRDLMNDGSISYWKEGNCVFIWVEELERYCREKTEASRKKF